jgi:uncharacterized membrane protein YhaH (DUF805 family)
MRRNWLRWLFTFEGRVGRVEYLVAGLVLAMLKFGIDRWLMGRSGMQLHLWTYELPSITMMPTWTKTTSRLFLTLWAITIPFFWAGISLTVRRLRDAGRNMAASLLFFVPLVKIVLFVALVFTPTDAGVFDEGKVDDSDEKESAGRDVVLGAIIAAVIGLVLISFGTQYLLTYAWGLFLGVPFLMGFVASWYVNRRGVVSAKRAVNASGAALILTGIALIGMAFEGLICLAMAFPLAAPFAIAGALVARAILKGIGRPQAAPGAFTACIALLPVMMVGERAAKMEPPVNAVTTSIVIDAPVDVVWRNVIAFPPLAPPEEAIFKAGVAYPIAGQIVGSGVGAVRYCRFSTGDFVEPITTWDENRLLAFNVVAQPPSLRELSPWEIVPPHIEKNYMRSQHGQFRLTALDAHRTLLEGTTWYQNYLWPQQYWREWSDGIVHRIHLRVLRHVKQQAEMAVRNGG